MRMNFVVFVNPLVNPMSGLIMHVHFYSFEYPLSKSIRSKTQKEWKKNNRKMYARFKCCDCKNIQTPQISSLHSHVDCRTTYDRFQMIIFIYKCQCKRFIFSLFRRLVIFFSFSFYLANCILFRFLWICSNNKIMKSMCDISAWRGGMHSLHTINCQDRQIIQFEHKLFCARSSTFDRRISAKQLRSNFK